MKKHRVIVNAIALSLISVTLIAQVYSSKEIIAEDPNWREDQRLHELVQRQAGKKPTFLEKEEFKQDPSAIMGVDYNWLEQRRRELAGEKDHRYDIKDRVE